MAAFAPQPVAVGSPAKAPTFDRLIFFFAASSEVVSSTSCLDWQPVLPGRMERLGFSSRPSGCRGSLVPPQDWFPLCSHPGVLAAKVRGFGSNLLKWARA